MGMEYEREICRISSGRGGYEAGCGSWYCSLDKGASRAFSGNKLNLYGSKRLMFTRYVLRLRLCCFLYQRLFFSHAVSTHSHHRIMNCSVCLIIEQLAR